MTDFSILSFAKISEFSYNKMLTLLPWGSIKMTVDRLTRGRRGRRQESANSVPTIAQHPFQQLKRPYPPVPIISDDQVEHIHQASLKLLSETGLDVLHDDARTLMKKAGADVRKGTVRVRFDPGLINEAIATAPSEFTLHARNPHHSVKMSGDNGH